MIRVGCLPASGSSRRNTVKPKRRISADRGEDAEHAVHRPGRLGQIEGEQRDGGRLARNPEEKQPQGVEEGAPLVRPEAQQGAGEHQRQDRQPGKGGEVDLIHCFGRF